tara:strand:+ start:493 stop:705 length:213 start_codon:yes stop_codon:yes gene_type:complete
MKIKLQMDTRTLQDVAMELTAHERECAVYRDMTKQSLDKLEEKIKRLEVVIWTSTVSILGTMITVIFKVM